MIDRRGRVSFDSRRRFLLILGMAGLDPFFVRLSKAPEPVPRTDSGWAIRPEPTNL